MKKNSNHATKPSGFFGSKKEIEYEEDDSATGKFGSRKMMMDQKRRPIRNLTKAWYDHGNHFEDIEEFYGK